MVAAVRRGTLRLLQDLRLMHRFQKNTAAPSASSSRWTEGEDRSI